MSATAKVSKELITKDLAAAEQYTRRLARSHYENFIVGGLLTPRPLRQHFYNVYAYCRLADDLADEIADPAESLRQLDQWEAWLEDCYERCTATHPVFVALAKTIDQLEIPITPFRNLLRAFRQDQLAVHYKDFDQLFAYCESSANPVGHMVLYLGRAYNEQRAKLSDAICTGLQLANFWQDIHRDFAIDRVYVPQQILDRFSVARQSLGSSTAPPAGPAMVQYLVTQTRTLFQQGLPLADDVPSWLGRNIRLFAGGGLAILDAIAAQDYDVWRRRPTVSRWKQFWLVATTLRFGKLA